MGGDALNIAAGALAVYQQQIGVISNNIANVGTTAFKDQTLLLQDAFYNPLKAASAPTDTNGGINPIQEGDGVQISQMSTDEGQGSFQTTGISTNLAIDGDGYFIMNSINGGIQPSYSRDGNFSVNQSGILVNSATGMAVQGYQASPAGKITPDGSVTSLYLPVGLSTKAIGTGFGTKTGPSSADSVFDMVQSGNLNQASWVTAAGGGTVTPQSTTTTIYDSLGGPHEVTLTYTPVANASLSTVNNAGGTPVQAATEWQVNASFADGTQITTASGTSASGILGYAYFDANGQYINSSSDPAATTASTTHTTGSTPAAAQGNIMDIASWGANNNATGSTAAVGAIALSYADLTSLSGTGEPVSTVNQNGYAQGQLTTIQIGGDGTITGSFSNGLQQTLGQVSIATFENPQGLVSHGSNQFIASADSGLAQIGTAGVGEAGSITSDSLEESNVSIATEFSKLIVAQNAYIANSKSITIGNQDLQTVDQLIQ